MESWKASFFWVKMKYPDKAFLGAPTALLNDKSIFYIKCREILHNSRNEIFAKHLLAQGIKSCILAPVIKDDKLLGIMELVSSKPKQLNSINANNLDLILYRRYTKRYNSDLENQLEAIIQREYTAIHPVFIGNSK
jgi:GAF domain-containing protein